MPINTDPRYVGRAWITPTTPVVGGEWGTWTVTYEVGTYGYDERARLKISWRFASDWGTPQFTDPKGANYTTGVDEPGLPGRLIQRRNLRWVSARVVAMPAGRRAPKPL